MSIWNGRLTASVILGLAFCSPAAAGESGFYAGLSVGQSDADVGTGPFDDLFSPPFQAPINSATSSTLDESDTAFGVFAGYEFSPLVGIEVTYHDLGKVDYVSRETRSGLFGGEERREVTNESKALSLAVVGRYPLTDELRLTGRAGLAARRLEADIKIFLNDRPVNVIVEDDTQSSGSILAGLGLEWRLHPSCSLRLDLQRHFDLDQGKAGFAPQADITLLSAGATFHF